MTKQDKPTMKIDFLATYKRIAEAMQRVWSGQKWIVTKENNED